MARLVAGFTVGTPQSAGLDTNALEDFRTSLERETDELRSLSGAAHLVLHKGQCVFSCASGLANQQKKTPFRFDTLCRMHGATKPIVACAFLTLVDKGRCRLSDHVEKYVPFPNRFLGRPSRSSKDKKTQRRPTNKAKKSMISNVKSNATLSDLLTQTAGLDDTDDKKAHSKAMRAIKRGACKNIKDLTESIAAEPLQSSPGTRYAYGLAIDILGRVCEVISGMPLDKFVTESFLKPMGMTDTHFAVPTAKRKRAATLYEARPVPHMRRRLYSLSVHAGGLKAPGIFSGGGFVVSYVDDTCLWSTARDQARFCQMILDGGVAPGGRRVLKSRTVNSFWSDALAGASRDRGSGRRDGRLPGWHDSDGKIKVGGWWDHRGLSLIHSFLDLDDAEPPSRDCKDRHSSNMWFSGGGGTYWTINRPRKLATISFTQTFYGREEEDDGFGPLACRIAPYV